MNQSSFAPRALRVLFRLTGNSFGAIGADTVTLDGLRVQAEITQAQFPVSETAMVRLYGLQPALINRLSLAAPTLNTQQASEITLTSLQPDGTETVVFEGGVTTAYADYNTAPENSFVVQAFSTALPNAQPATPTSFCGVVPASQLLGAVAAKAGLRFVNYGVESSFHTPYLYGSPGQQLAQCLETTPMRMGLGRGQLTVWPLNAAPAAAQNAQSGQRIAEPVVSVSASTGLVGYPSWSAGGMVLRLLFNPFIGFNTLVQVQSQYQPAGWGQNGTGLWRVLQARHSLYTQTPNGAWFTYCIAQAVL